MSGATANNGSSSIATLLEEAKEELVKRNDEIDQLKTLVNQSTKASKEQQTNLQKDNTTLQEATCCQRRRDR
jgi:hypothetical protein